ncbi:MAG: FkbM family methyltransferase [Bacteroidia bacterium]|nr:FkbM family methyltransferase [Bacteroidia bacterium]
MAKKLILKFLRSAGYDLVKTNTSKKTKYSTELEFFETKTGNYYLPKHAPNDIISNTIKSDKIFDHDIYDIASKYVIKGSTVLDVGSNFGQMAILFSELTGKDGTVHAFDADDFVFSILQKNIEANGKPNIFAHFGAVHDKNDETLYFPIQDFKRFTTFGSYGIDYKNKQGRPVNTITIDSLNIQEPISFMKIDVQGGDLFALKGAKQTILKHKMPILFEYEYLFEDELNLCFQDYIDFVKEINYKFSKVINGQNYLILPIE